MIELRKISILDDNMKDCIELEVSPEQAKFVAHNAVSLGQAYAVEERGLGSKVAPYAIYTSGKMVGFVMYGFFKHEYDDEFNEGKDYYSFWRLMIDKDRQGKGYGKQAMTQIIDEIKQKPFGEAEHCYISYEPDNPAKKMYKSFGFEETGQISDGELVARMKL
ncbi:MAG: GNAT family N-acetyltransferase [Defluviitaleaceae bacterium]|nr:GNAT family N-acetyltransferase [Defluviitaleaceae bacterium]